VRDLLMHRPGAPFAEQIQERPDRNVERIAQQRMTVPIDDGNLGKIDDGPHASNISPISSVSPNKGDAPDFALRQLRTAQHSTGGSTCHSRSVHSLVNLGSTAALASG
jgi:hypothetical protein